jgi:hypothetical protein
LQLTFTFFFATVTVAFVPALLHAAPILAFAAAVMAVEEDAAAT